MADKQLEAYYGKDLPNASYRWGVVVPITDVCNVTHWRAVAWFKSRKRAVEYANSGWSNYAIARLK